MTECAFAYNGLGHRHYTGNDDTETVAGRTMADAIGLPARHSGFLRLLRGPRENDEQEAHNGHSRAVIDPLGMPDEDAIGGKVVKPEALSHEAQSGDQGNNPDDSQ